MTETVVPTIEEQLLAATQSLNLNVEKLYNLTLEQTEVINGIYVLLLWVIGVLGAVFVLFLLYKFVRLFF